MLPNTTILIFDPPINKIAAKKLNIQIIHALQVCLRDKGKIA